MKKFFIRIVIFTLTLFTFNYFRCMGDLDNYYNIYFFEYLIKKLEMLFFIISNTLHLFRYATNELTYWLVSVAKLQQIFDMTKLFA